MLEDGLGYPLRDDWIGRIVIGGVLGFLSFLIVPLIALNGYLFRVIEGTIRGEDVPPEFTEWGDMLARGVGVTVVAFAYGFVPLILYFLVVFVVLGAGAAAGGDAGGVLAGFGVLASLLLIPVLLFAYYVIPAAIANYANSGEIEDAFAISEITDVVFTGEYVAAILLPIVVGVVLWIVSMVLAVTIVGIVFLPFVQFYGQVAVFRMFGSAYAANVPTGA
ncbi:MAG: DUF4013 domain-containing protein [Halanaeroarchaeum sp.]